ncbi:hypothetical protein H8356DRAFT_1280615 [Neocallimastix lanati (nom. inval.)]|nr:hypothetical protein H8356DRAFT_1280615 [Neocallimastix sp. JGI-2020a]
MRKDILKVVIIGDGGVGKTSIRVQYIHRRFTSNYKATIGADFITKDVQLEDGKKVSMQIWDTAGQERFQSLGIAYYRGADACIIVFDVTNPDSFNHVLKWEHEFIDKADLKDPSTYPFVLIGNKIDNENDRMISKSQGKRMAIKMREQSIKESSHYGLIQQNKYIPEDDNIQSYNDSLLTIYQRSSSYKKYSYALHKENQNNKKTNNSSSSSNKNNSNSNNRNKDLNPLQPYNFNNSNMLNTDNVEGLTLYSVYKNNNKSNGNSNNNYNYEEDEDSTDYEDYDDLENYRIPYFEVSAKYGDNIEAAFHHIAKTVQLPQFEFLIEGDTINWNDDEISRTNNCCF